MKDQNLISVFMVSAIVFLGVPGVVSAEARVSGEELKKLLSGNTAEGRYLKWKKTHKMFFDASGKIRRTDSLGNKESGEWYINDKSELCIRVKKERCNEVTKRGDGGYDVSRNGMTNFTFDKIVPGNPNNL